MNFVHFSPPSPTQYDARQKDAKKINTKSIRIKFWTPFIYSPHISIFLIISRNAPCVFFFLLYFPIAFLLGVNGVR